MGYGINRCSNGYLLPSSKQLAEATGLALHSGGHLDSYYRSVSDRLEGLDSVHAQLGDAELLAEIGRIEEAILDDLLNHRVFLSSKDPRYLAPYDAVVSKFRLWRHDNESPWFEAHFVDDPLPTRYIPLNSDDPWPRDVPIRISVDRPPYDHFSCGPLHVCSPPLQSVLAVEPVEFLPVELLGHPADGYAALHVMARAPVLDRDRSEVLFHTDGKIKDVRTIVTDETVSPPAGIFKVSASYLGPWV